MAPQNSIDLSRRTAQVIVTTTVTNDGSEPVSVTVDAQVNAPSGGATTGEHPVAEQVLVAPGALVNVTHTFQVNNTQLWSPESPSLYKATVTIISNKYSRQYTHTVNEAFGIRLISFDSTSGFQLNGIQTKLRGGCVHHDNGPLGSRAIDRAEERRVELLKAAGYNAIRTSHNPVQPETCFSEPDTREPTGASVTRIYTLSSFRSEPD